MLTDRNPAFDVGPNHAARRVFDKLCQLLRSQATTLRCNSDITPRWTVEAGWLPLYNSESDPKTKFKASSHLQVRPKSTVGLPEADIPKPSQHEVVLDAGVGEFWSDY